MTDANHTRTKWWQPSSYAVTNPQSDTARPSRSEWLMSLAEVTAHRATCSRLSVGAVLVRNSKVLGTGYNGSPAGLPHCRCTPEVSCTESVHAEANVVANAAYHGNATAGATLYITHAPCRGCAGLLINAGLVGVSFGQHYRDEDGLNLLSRAGVRTYHQPGAATIGEAS